MKQLLRKPFYVIAFLVINISFNSTKLQAQAGTLDVSFGDSGIAYPNTKISFSNIALLSNNKIIVCGHYYNGTEYITTSCFKPNGAIDSLYGDNGSTKTNLEGYNYAAGGHVAIQENDRIVIAGIVQRTENDTIISKGLLFRLYKNGKPDSSFGINGSIVDIHTFGQVLIQPNGKIVCAGSGPGLSGYNNLFLYRFNTNGTPDSTFGTNGICTIDFFPKDAILANFLLKPNGQFVSSGNAAWYDSTFEMAETGVSGHLIKNFGTGGKVERAGNEGKLVGVQSNGRLIAVCPDNKRNGLFFLGYTSNGVIDSSFGVNGIYHMQHTEILSFISGGFYVQDDDKIIGTGRNDNNKLCVYRLLPNGKFDTSFADHGIFRLENAPNAEGHYIQLMPNKKILVSGNLTSSFKGLLIRLNNDATHAPLAAEATEQ